jgi:hypothetical protein
MLVNKKRREDAQVDFAAKKTTMPGRNSALTLLLYTKKIFCWTSTLSSSSKMGRFFAVPPGKFDCIIIGLSDRLDCWIALLDVFDFFPNNTFSRSAAAKVLEH